MLREAQEQSTQFEKEKENEVTELKNTCTNQKKENEELQRRVERMTEAYQLVVKANTKELQRFDTLRFLRRKKGYDGKKGLASNYSRKLVTGSCYFS